MSEDLRNLIERYNRERDSRAFAPLADAYRKQGDVAKAIELLEQGLERFPQYASAHVILGKCFYDTGGTERAKAEFRRVLELDAENMVALKFLGDILLAEERREEAAECYRRLLAIDPRNEDAARALKDMQHPLVVKEIDLGDTKIARDERPRELATITLAGIYAAQGYYNKAIAIYREVLAREPLNREAKEMVQKLQAMLDTSESERDQAFEEPVLSISLDEVSDDIAASTAGRGGAEVDASEPLPAEAKLQDEASFADVAPAQEPPAESSAKAPELVKEEKPDEVASAKEDTRSTADMEQFRAWLKKAKGS
jgi:tetratricopeptide (TPR) repeat protein